MRVEQKQVQTLSVDEMLRILKPSPKPRTEQEKAGKPAPSPAPQRIDQKPKRPDPTPAPANKPEPKPEPEKEPDFAKLLQAHRAMLEEVLGKELPKSPYFEDYDLAFCEALLKEGYTYSQVGEVFSKLLKDHVFYQKVLSKEERKEYLQWLEDKVKEGEKALKSGKAVFRIRR